MYKVLTRSLVDGEPWQWGWKSHFRDNLDLKKINDEVLGQ